MSDDQLTPARARAMARGRGKPMRRSPLKRGGFARNKAGPQGWSAKTSGDESRAGDGAEAAHGDDGVGRTAAPNGALGQRARAKGYARPSLSTQSRQFGKSGQFGKSRRFGNSGRSIKAAQATKTAQAKKTAKTKRALAKIHRVVAQAKAGEADNPHPGRAGLTAWEAEFTKSVAERLETYGSAFADPEKGDVDAALSVLQTVKLKQIAAKTRKAMRAAQGNEPAGPDGEDPSSPGKTRKVVAGPRAGGDKAPTRRRSW